jgi:hypothetical protein
VISGLIVRGGLILPLLLLLVVMVVSCALTDSTAHTTDTPVVVKEEVKEVVVNSGYQIVALGRRAVKVVGIILQLFQIQ